MSQDAIFAFVLMPFDQGFDDLYRLGIKETAKGLGILAERVDEQIYREGILERIYRQIEYRRHHRCGYEKQEPERVLRSWVCTRKGKALHGEKRFNASGA
ncbi:MAG: hypothetical protein ACLQU1_43800 [Bryobacteraceae bacterium]